MTYLSEVLADSPRHYWRMADPGGLWAFDIGSVPKHLMLNGNVPFGSPCLGMNVDGGSLALQGAAYPWFKDLEIYVLPITVECWFYQQAYVGLAQYLVDIARSGAFLTALQVDATGHPVIQMPGAGVAVTGAAALTVQAWHHVVGVITSLGATTLYVNGASVNTGAAAAPASTNYMHSVGGVVPTAGSYFTGNISEVAVYVTALSAARVAAHYAAADATTQKPIYRGFGTWSSTTGSSDLLVPTLDAVLASVRKNYVNAP